MAVENKRMQQRHGTYAQFQSEMSDFLPYEFINVSSGDPNSSDGKSLYYQPDTGNPKRILTDDDGQSFYTIDITTTDPQYSSAQANTLYLNAQVDNAKGIVFTGANKDYQIFLGRAGSILYRGYSGGDTYSNWTPFARSSITGANKTRADLIPSIKAVVGYISSQLLPITTQLDGINEDLANIGDDLLQMEDIAHKVSTIDPSSATDAQYPSARAVVKYVNSVLNN